MRNAIAILLWLVLTILSTQDLRAQAVKLMASDASALAFFGYAVALSGEYAVVGAPGEDADTGAAYVFVNDPVDGWTRKAKLTADAPAIGDAFGFSVDIDGSFIVVGTPGDDDGGNDAGAAYVFFNDPVAGWTRQAKLTTPDAALEDRLGYAVAISGIFIIVGAPGHDDGAFETGAAYAFTFNPPTGWSQQAKLSAPSAEEGDFFGETVALDDATALIGAPSADDPRGLAQCRGESRALERTLGARACGSAWRMEDVSRPIPRTPREQEQVVGAGSWHRGHREEEILWTTGRLGSKRFRLHVLTPFGASRRSLR